VTKHCLNPKHVIINGVPSGTSGSITNGQTIAAVQVNTVVTATGPIPTTRAIVNTSVV
jgi:hypothetical protein